MAEEIKIGSDLYNDENLDQVSKKKLLRFDKFWICLTCKTKERNKYKKSNIDIGCVNVNEKTCFVPGLDERVDEMFKKKISLFTQKHFDVKTDYRLQN